MSLSGSLEDLGPAELLHVMGISRRSGVLLIESRGREYSFLFRDGDITAVRHGRSPASLGELLVRAGITDTTHLAVLERQARREGKTVVDLLSAEGVLHPGTIEKQIESEIEQVVASLLDAREGTFRLRLVSDPRETAAEFGELVLEKGLQPTRLAGIRERTRQGGFPALDGMKLLRGVSKRQAELLIPEDDISLPLPSSRPGQRPSQEQQPPEAAEPAPLPSGGPSRHGGSAPVAMLALPSGALRRSVATRLAGEGFDVRIVAQAADLAPALEASVLRGDPVVGVGLTSYEALPGIEMLMRVKLAQRSIGFVLLQPTASPAADQALRHQAERLGATHVLALSAAEPDARGAELVGELVAGLVSHAARSAADEAAAAAATASPSGAAGLDELFGTLGATPLLTSLPQAEQARLLAERAGAWGTSPDMAHVALSVLEAAAEYAPRVVLFLKTKDTLRPFGAAGDAEPGVSLASRLRRLSLSLSGGELACRLAREGRSFIGAPVPSPADDALLARLGSVRPAVLAVMPIGLERSCVGVVHADDGGAGALPDLSALVAFLAEAGVPVRTALSAAERRADARKALRTS